MTWLGFSGALFGALTLAVACSSDDDKDPVQCKPTPAFDLTVRAVAGSVPADTLIHVKYGGGNETYKVNSGNPDEKVVLCENLEDDAGAVSAIHCKVWTQSTATVTVTTASFPTVKHDYDAETDGDGCFKTKPIEIVLGDQDAGT